MKVFVNVFVMLGVSVMDGVSVGVTGVGVGVMVGGGGPGRPMILSRKTAIWPRVLELSGQ